MSETPRQQRPSVKVVKAERISPQPEVSSTRATPLKVEEGDMKPNTKPAELPREAAVIVAEALIARGLIRTLANLNAASKRLNLHTLPSLWRTVIWYPKVKDELEDQGETDAAWRRIMVDSPGSEYIE
jgi:hypothetical protein